MKLKDILTNDTWEKYGDLDVVNDVTDSMACAWCGTLLTKTGLEDFKEALELDAEIYYANGLQEYVICINRKAPYDWAAAKHLFSCMAGYCNEEYWNIWFTDEHPEPPEIDKAEWVKKYLEPAMVAAGCGIKHLDYYKHEEPYIDDNYRTHYDEEIVVTYESGFTRLINVACDSKAAMVEDLYKQGGVY